VPDDDLLRRYRRLLVTDVPADQFIQLRYRITPAEQFDLRGAAIRLLLILSQRTLLPLGFEDVKRSDINAIGAVLTPPGPQGSGAVTIALPLHVLSEREGLTQLILTATSAAEYSYTSEVWLDDIVLPSSVRQWFQGPRHGVQGIRDALGVHGRPLVAYTVKSRTRVTLQTVLGSCREALTGGVDLLVDDLLSTDPDGELAFARRVTAISNLVREHNERTRAGHSSLAGYIVNIGSSTWRAAGYLRTAQDAGVFGCLVDCFTMGFGNVHDLIDHAHSANESSLAFIATNMGSGIMGRNPDDEHLDRALNDRRFLRTGFSEALTAKLSRLVGADGVHTGTAGSECFEVAEYAHTHRNLSVEFGDLRQAFAVTEGDIQFTHVADNVLEMGTDIIIETASGIANHPAGVESGARAFRLLAGCLSDDLTREDVDDILNVLRFKYPKIIEPFLPSWKKEQDARIRAGWSLDESSQALQTANLSDELRALLPKAQRRGTS
jgi:ribulose 1,5-bisphosphate carboxylase large subunit-like protein